jgi:hypothetical protein
MRKIIRFVPLVLLAVTVSVPAGASASQDKHTDQPSVEGQWTGRVTGTPHGDMDMTLTLKQDGTKVTGTLTTEHTGDVAVEGELTDHTLKLATTAHGDVEFTMAGTLKDDGSLAGTLSTSGGDMTWFAKRTKATR